MAAQDELHETTQGCEQAGQLRRSGETEGARVALFQAHDSLPEELRSESRTPGLLFSEALARAGAHESVQALAAACGVEEVEWLIANSEPIAAFTAAEELASFVDHERYAEMTPLWQRAQRLASVAEEVAIKRAVQMAPHAGTLEETLDAAAQAACRSLASLGSFGLGMAAAEQASFCAEHTIGETATDSSRTFLHGYETLVRSYSIVNDGLWLAAVRTSEMTAVGLLWATELCHCDYQTSLQAELRSLIPGGRPELLITLQTTVGDTESVSAPGDEECGMLVTRDESENLLACSVDGGDLRCLLVPTRSQRFLEELPLDEPSTLCRQALRSASNRSNAGTGFELELEWGTGSVNVTHQGTPYPGALSVGMHQVDELLGRPHLAWP